jgi:prevent-host-death family protein
MLTSTIAEAQAQLPLLIDKAAQGEIVVIAQAGKPVARIVPYNQPEGQREGGQWQGRVRIAPDFDELPPDLADAFGLPGK